MFVWINSVYSNCIFLTGFEVNMPEEKQNKLVDVFPQSNMGEDPDNIATHVEYTKILSMGRQSCIKQGKDATKNWPVVH